MSDQEEQQPVEKQKIEFANSTVSLKARLPQLTLPPYSPFSKDALVERPVVLTSEAPTITEMPEQYQGRQAQNIVYEIAQPVSLPGNEQYAYPINQYEDGQLVHFTVSSDSDAIRAVLLLYDIDNRATTICSDTARDLVNKGRGMTLSQALAVDMNGISLDHPGQPHTVMPYVSRYKNTFSLGFVDPGDYPTVAGTENDKFYIIEYAPAIPRGYKKIYFNIQNRGADTKTIHYVVVNRYSFIEKYDFGPIPTTASGTKRAGRKGITQQEEGTGSYSSLDEGNGSGSGSSASYARMRARKARVRL